MVSHQTSTGPDFGCEEIHRGQDARLCRRTSTGAPAPRVRTARRPLQRPLIGVRSFFTNHRDSRTVRHPGEVINPESPVAGAGRDRFYTEFTVAEKSGIVKQNVAPRSGLFIPHSRPPCASTIVRLMANPRPSPSCFVVWNGSKSLASLSGWMPVPRSLTST